MALIRWEPVRELNTIQSEMNRLFNTYFDSPTPANGGAALRRWIPAMDLAETEQEFVLRADLPGVSEDDVKIELEDRVLTISGERKAEHEERKEGYYRVERSSGVLEVRIPKPVEKKHHRVTISVGNGDGTANKAEAETEAPAAIEGTPQAA